MCPPDRDNRRERPQAPAVRGMHQDGRFLGAPAHLPTVRGDAVLRQFAEPSRQQARAREQAPRPCFGGAWRALAILLSGRPDGRVLTLHAPACPRRILPSERIRMLVRRVTSASSPPISIYAHRCTVR